MMKTFIISAIAFCLIFSTQTVSAQVNMPRPSPASTVMQKVGLAEITISYSRPSVKGRKVFGDLVPYNKMWRTGANEPTRFTVSDTIKVEGTSLNPGDYAIYTLPGETEWTIFFGKNPKVGVQDFKEADAALKFKVKSQKTCEAVESFTIEFNDVTNGSANVALKWENTKVQFKVENQFDAEVMADIKQKTDNSMVYFQAAAYYYETNRDMKQALEWVNKATEKNPMFFQLHLKAKIQQRLNDCKGAIETAQKSIELSKAAKNDEYVKMNEQLIAECKKK